MHTIVEYGHSGYDMARGQWESSTPAVPLGDLPRTHVANWVKRETHLYLEGFPDRTYLVEWIPGSRSKWMSLWCFYFCGALLLSPLYRWKLDRECQQVQYVVQKRLLSVIEEPRPDPHSEDWGYGLKIPSSSNDADTENPVHQQG
mgnify:CR=1 FL=1